MATCSVSSAASSHFGFQKASSLPPSFISDRQRFKSILLSVLHLSHRQQQRHHQQHQFHPTPPPFSYLYKAPLCLHQSLFHSRAYAPSIVALRRYLRHRKCAQQPQSPTLIFDCSGVPSFGLSPPTPSHRSLPSFDCLVIMAASVASSYNADHGYQSNNMTTTESSAAKASNPSSKASSSRSTQQDRFYGYRGKLTWTTTASIQHLGALLD